MPSDSPEAIRGKPIDGSPLPDWARPYLSPDQLSLDRGLLWVLLIYKARNLGSSATSVAQRLYVHTLGKAHKKAWPSQPALAGDLELKSENTVRAALVALEKRGWLIKGEVSGGRISYTLAWPPFDCLAPTPTESPVLCAVPTDTGLCRRRAGWGTQHRGTGRCKLHDDTEAPQPLRGSDGSKDATPPQPLREESALLDSAPPQPLRPDPSTVEGVPPQPLSQAPSTVEDKYVSECVTGVGEMSNEGCPPSRAEVEVPPVEFESDEDRDVVDEGEVRPQPVRSNDAPAVEPKHLIAVPDECIHGRPGGYLPGPNPPSDRDIWPTCRRCQDHVTANQCHKKRQPCQQCNDIRAAAGKPLLQHQEIA